MEEIGFVQRESKLGGVVLSDVLTARITKLNAKRMTPDSGIQNRVSYVQEYVIPTANALTT